MRGMDLFCVSQAATSVHLTSTDAPASSSSSTVHLSSSRLIDRHNPIITDSSRATPKHPPSAPNSAPLTPKNDNTTNKGKKKNKKSGNSDFVSTISCAKGGGFISPSGSTRFLLEERTGFLEVEPDFEPAIPVLPTEHTDKTETEKKLDVKTDSILDQASSSRSSNQVVVLRVSLHCKGCAGKVKKHISRMRGVTSFNIDFAAKKVTVVGDVTPLEVLASISKVKTAQLWTPPKPSPLPSINPSTCSKINKSKAIVA